MRSTNSNNSSNRIKKLKKEQDDIKQRQELAAKKLRENAAVRQKLETIRTRYMAVVGSDNAQSRGFELERVMYELLELFDLNPKASFKNLGEQIDGAGIQRQQWPVYADCAVAGLRRSLTPPARQDPFEQRVNSVTIFQLHSGS